METVLPTTPVLPEVVVVVIAPVADTVVAAATMAAVVVAAMEATSLCLSVIWFGQGDE